MVQIIIMRVLLRQLNDIERPKTNSAKVGQKASFHKNTICYMRKIHKNFQFVLEAQYGKTLYASLLRIRGL